VLEIMPPTIIVLGRMRSTAPSITVRKLFNDFANIGMNQL
jgi:hypothetical protein